MKNIFLSYSHEDRGTVEYLLQAREIIKGQAVAVSPRCATCGQAVNQPHQHFLTAAPPNVQAPATDNHESPLALVLDGHQGAAAKFYTSAVDSIIKLDREVGSVRAIFYTVFFSGVSLFLVYEFTQMVLHLSKDWSGTVQLLFRLMLVGVLVAIVGFLWGNFDARVLSLLSGSRLGARGRSLLRSCRSCIREHLPILGEQNGPRPTVLWPQSAL